jgi:hypothetical protein
MEGGEGRKKVFPEIQLNSTSQHLPPVSPVQLSEVKKLQAFLSVQ